MIAVGVDTHKAAHYAVALDKLGQLLGEHSFTANAAGYAKLYDWGDAVGCLAGGRVRRRGDR